MNQVQVESRMFPQFRTLSVEKFGDVFIVVIRRDESRDPMAEDVGAELRLLAEQEACRKVIISLAELGYLGSMLLGQLLSFRKLLAERHGTLRICDASPMVREIFAVSMLERFFDFKESREDALIGW